MNNLTRIQILVVIFIFGIGVLIYKNWDRSKPTLLTAQNIDQGTNPPQAPAVAQKDVVAPIKQAELRVTKKPFGIYITKETSPVQPERFSGYHTAVDFETFPNEADVDVPFFAICTGKILQKRTASGYGGVLVQSCTIEKRAVTVIYGHISVSSISKNAGDTLTQGEEIGYLGQPPGETDGERKHLHLGIHLGTAVNILGYVQKQSDLSAWLDFQKLSN